MADTSELLRACEHLERCVERGDYPSEHALTEVTRYAKSRLQAEAQAPTTAAQASVLTEDDRKDIRFARVLIETSDRGVLRDTIQRLVEIIDRALVSSPIDNPELDGTDYAHPAWWRGNDSGVHGATAQVLKMFTEEHHSGSFNHVGLNTIRTKIHELRGVGAPAPAPTHWTDDLGPEQWEPAKGDTP